MRFRWLNHDHKTRREKPPLTRGQRAGWPTLLRVEQLDDRWVPGVTYTRSAAADGIWSDPMNWTPNTGFPGQSD
jgi:hypothetical protein